MKYVLSLTVLILLFTGVNLYSQDADVVEFRDSSIKAGIGAAFNEGLKEEGAGLTYSIGWQKSYGKKKKFRLNPYLFFGSFTPFGTTDVRNQYYRISSLNLELHYDLIRYKSVSLVTTAGAFVNYSRGLIGTGGQGTGASQQSEHFYRFYDGLSASVGLRIAPQNSRFAYKWKLVGVQAGVTDFILAYSTFNIDIRLKK